jgi:uncharacterized phiE125 gp8 family phage protein
MLHTAARLVTPPAVEVLSLADFKAHARIEHTAEDATIESYVVGARQYAEDVRGRAYCQQTWQMQFDRLSVPLRLIPCPVMQVLSIQYLDTAGATQTLAADQYRVDLLSEPARVIPAYNVCWPATLCEPGAVTVKFLAGWLTPLTADATANTLTAVLRTFADDEIVSLSTLSGGELPAPLEPNRGYYVMGSTGSTFQLALTEGGAAIDLTDTSTDPFFVGSLPEPERQLIRLLAGHSYENREPIVVGSTANTIPFTLDSLIWRDRVWF